MRKPRPLPDIDGVPAARLSMPTASSCSTVWEFLVRRTGHAGEVTRRLEAGEVVLGDGSVVRRDTRYRPGGWVYLYRDLPDEVRVPGEITVLHADSDIVVVDKPPFLATMPRGSHVVQTVVTRLRRELGLPDLVPAHRLDRLTSGVLLLTVRPEVRGAYQGLFARRAVAKTYLALAPVREDLPLPVTVRSRIVKRRGSLQALEEPGEPNAVTMVELLGPQRVPSGDGENGARPQRDAGAIGRYRLTPHTGRTHQLRLHLASLGIPIVNDPLYPTVLDRAPDDFTRPLQLLAHRLEFTDPFTGRRRTFTSRRRLGGGSASG